VPERFAHDCGPPEALEGRLIVCGIAGIVSLRGKSVEPGDIENLTDRLAHRGPDGSGYWFDAERSVALGHRRLAIIDPGPGGYQPMLSEDARHVIVFNGEIYNFLELRRELEALGVHFRTQSDTEVILAAWRAWREAMLQRFNGMWALAIFDTTTKDLFLARDRFGIKPLLYAVSAERLVFASEQRALVQGGMVATSVDVEVARRLMFDAFGVEASQRTLYRGIRRLQAGHFLWLRSGKLEIQRWWRTVDHLPALPKTGAERVERFRELFEDAVALRMRSDVPIGTCLSGGFDSSAVLCTMAAHEKAGMGPRDSASWRHAFVATFPGASNDERPFAEQAAKWANVDPVFLEIGSNDALTDLERILADNDDVYIGPPSAAWLIYRQLRRHNVVVSLDGHGADELMGAYRQEGQATAFWLRNALAGLSANSDWAGRGVDFLRALAIKRRGHYFLRGGLRDIPPPLSLTGEGDAMPRDWGSLNKRLYRMFHGTVLPTILRNFDRVSMAHGIEVRMPFMDWRLVTYTMALPDATKASGEYSKVIARKAMEQRMPESIRMARRKVGFNSPMPEWLNGPLEPWIGALLDRNIPAFTELVDENRLRDAVRRLTASKAWDWQSAGGIWPYLNMKWMLARYG
jgi:asparagine synthase (glutamine-hydrolysing)